MPAGCEDEGAGAELAAGSEAEVRPKEMAADEAGAAAVAGASAGALVAAELEAEVAMVGSDKPPEPNTQHTVSIFENPCSDDSRQSHHMQEISQQMGNRSAQQYCIWTNSTSVKLWTRAGRPTQGQRGGCRGRRS